MSEKKKKIEPTKAQRLAMEASGSDLLISAGAGSGKTATLTRRIVDKIVAGQSISDKLIVTFTKDASNELKSRISDMLSAELENDPSNGHIARQIVALGRADICTIDSFCLKLVRENFERLGLEGGFRIADESENEVLCRDAMSEVVDTLFEERGEDDDFLLVCDCFSGFSNEQRLKDELLELYKRLVNTKDGIDTLLLNIDPKGDFMDTAYGEALRVHTDSLCDYYINFYNCALELIKDDEGAQKALLRAFVSDRDFAVRIKNIVKDKSYKYIGEALSAYVPERLGKKTELEGEYIEELIKARDRFKKEIKELYSGYFSLSDEVLLSSFEKNAQMCRALYGVLDEFEREYQKKKRLAGVCDFNDISRYAYKLLYDEREEITPLAREIAEGYDEVYVDEYQDTNLIQDKIFYAVSRNNRFLVGDIKQSIYRFRSAEPEIFAEYRRTFEPITVGEDTDKSDELKPNYASGGSPTQIAMAENFRCDKSIIDFSNAVSGFLFTNTGTIPYDEGDALKFAKPNCDYKSERCEVYLIDKTRDKDAPRTEESEDELLRREAEFVADKIKKMLDGESLPNGKKIEPSDIAILLRGFKKPIRLYTEALAKRGILSEYRGDEHFYQKSEILLTLCILNAIDNPLRDVYLAGAMRSGVFGFSLEDMVKIREGVKGADSFYDAVRAYDKSDELKGRIDNFLNKLEKYREECRKKSAHEVIALIYADTSIMASASKNERKSLMKLYDIARAYEGGRYKGLYSFLRYVEGIKEGSGKEDLGDADGNGVKLMSVHSSKGLEFEVCFVCACGAEMRTPDADKPMLFHRRLGVNTYVARPRGLAKFNTILRKCSALAIRRDSIADEMNMLYVAMTRARSRLIITGGVKEPYEFLKGCELKRKFATEYSILKPKSYLEWVLLGIGDKPELAKISVEADIKVLEAREQEKERKAEMSDEAQKMVEILKSRFEYEYPYSHLRDLPSKLTISSLHPTVLDEEAAAEDDSYELDDVPSFARERGEEVSASDKGTATHIFMQFCNFASLAENGAEAELKRLLLGGYISKETSKLVSIEHVEKFTHSELFYELLRAKGIRRELRFNVMLPAIELSENEELRDKRVLVQGVTDCIYENDKGELILVDYKTDRVTEQNYIQVLTKRHKNQLTYYKKATELMFEKEVSRTLIYSVPLAKCVELK